MDVWFAGCAAVVKGPRCLISDRQTLRLWARTNSTDRAEIKIDGHNAHAQSKHVLDGTQWTIDVPPAAEAIEVLVWNHTNRFETFRLALARDFTDPVIKKAIQLREKGNFDAAEQSLAKALRSSDATLQGTARGWMGRIALSRGDTARAMADLRASIPLLRKTERISESIDNALALSHVARERWQLETTRHALQSIDPILDQYPEGRARALYYRGLLVKSLGDLREAFSLLVRAKEDAERLGMDSLRRNSTQARAWMLVELGRTQEALQDLESLAAEIKEEDSPCERANIETNLGWLDLWAQEHQSLSRDPKPHLERALKIYRSTCPRANLERNALVNLALFAVQGDDLDQARTYISQARQISSERAGDVTAWLLDTEGRIALREHQPQIALAIYDELQSRARMALAHSSLWQAALGRGKALEALEQWDEAERAYQEAETYLDEAQYGIRTDEGRDTFFGEREQSAQHLIDVLIQQGKAKEAFAAARKARIRFLRSLAKQPLLSTDRSPQRQDSERLLSEYYTHREALSEEIASAWRLSMEELRSQEEKTKSREALLHSILDRALSAAHRTRTTDQMRAPLPGELMLAYFRGDKNWVGFAAQGSEVHAEYIGTDLSIGPPEDIAQKFLVPFASHIDRAERLTLMIYGPLRSVDFHALPFRGKPLIATLPVAYAVDISLSNEAPMLEKTALVIADPRRDLQHASKESQVVTTALEAQSFWVHRLEPPKFSFANIRNALERSTWFHYAGHSEFDEVRAWDSKLLFAHEDGFMVGDILTLSKVPDVAVLMGCETGQSASHTSFEGLGLANAFVLVGSKTVLSARRKVSDKLSLELSKLIYNTNLTHSEPWKHFHRAQLALSRRFPESDWQSFRITIP